MNSPRVALVLYGQPRFVHLPYSSWSHKRILRNLDYKVLGHCWVASQGESMEASSWSSIKDLRYYSNATKDILFRYPNAEIEFEEALTEDDIPMEKLAWAIDANQGEKRPEKLKKNVTNLVSHMTSLRKALRLLEKHNSQSPFDFVILSRYDAVIVKFPNILNLIDSKLYLSRDHDRFPDFIIAGSVEKILALDGLDLLFEQGADEDLLIAEHLKSRSFHRFFTPGDIVTINAISRPLRTGGRFSSIVKLLISFVYSQVIGRVYRFVKNRKAVLQREIEY